jgi:hypothetical protein
LEAKYKLASHHGWFDAQEDIWYDASDGSEEEVHYVTSAERERAFKQLLHLLRPVKSQLNKRVLTSTHLLCYVATVRLLEDLEEHNHEHHQVVGGAYIATDQQHSNIPIVIDSSCSFSVTPFLEDFTRALKSTAETKMTGLSDLVNIKGVSWVDWPVQDVFNHVALLRTKAYYIPKACICLFSSQTYFQENDKGLANPSASLHQDHEKVILTMALGEELVFNYQPHSNLPLMFLDLCTDHAGLTGQQSYELISSSDLKHTMTLLDDNNYNLMKPQKELLLWHS